MPNQLVTIGGSHPTYPVALTFNSKVAAHSYGAAHADWTLTDDEAECTILSVTSADAGANAIVPATNGKVYVVRNTSGQTITVKASGQTGVGVVNGTIAWLLGNGTDVAATSLTAVVSATTSAEGIAELATAAEVLARTDTTRIVTAINDGLANSIVQTTTGAVTAAQMHGQTHVVTGAAVLTLPTVAAGLNAVFVTIGAIAVSIKAGASDKITLKATALDDGDKITNGSTDGDTIQILANAAGTDWQTGFFHGTWTDGGA